ncbi:MAG: hypothetical protein PUD36_09540 [Bacteroidales bacterium]|nr:hypothetical protein [Bacteroidales bacterium]
MSVLKGLPDLSAEWLMRGEGEMWRSDIKISGDQKAEGGSVLVGHGSEVGSIANNAPSALNLQENERLRAEVQHHKETIKELKEQNGFLKEQLKTSLQTVANLTSK